MIAQDQNIVIDKWKLFERLGYKVYHKNVRRFHNSSAKVKVCTAPRRTTKSYSAAKDCLPDILRPGTRTWIVGPNYTLAEKEFRYIHQDLVINRDRLGLPKPRVCMTNPRSGSLYIEFQWGSIVEGKSADSLVSLLGEEVDVALYSEASQLARGVRERYVQPTLITRGGRELIPTTPDALGEWVQEEVEFAANPNFPEIESFTWDVSANPRYNMDDFNLAKRKYGEDSAIFREQYLGEWVFYAGLIYNNIDPKIHIIEPFDIPKSWPVIRAIDFGARDPFVCLLFAVGPNAELYQFKEYYNRETTVPMRIHAMNIKEMCKGYNIVESVGDPASKQSIEDLCYEDVMCSPADNERAAGRMRVMEYLMPTEEAAPPFQNAPDNPHGKWPRLFTFSDQRETIREQKFYRWKERKGVKAEMDKEKTEGEDHAMDCRRYGIYTRPSPFEIKNTFKAGSFDYEMDKMIGSNVNTGHIGYGKIL